MDADYLATGHYARVGYEGGAYQLLRAIDDSKDQSYVLYTLGQQELSRVLFPVGHYPKTGIRRLAFEMGLPLHDKPDSAEICFVPGQDYRAFVAERVPQSAGVIIDQDGAIVGEHQGIAGYTIGQRKGIGAFGAKRFVTGIDAEQNLIMIGDEDALMNRTLMADVASWVGGAPPASEFRAEVKVRYKSSPAPATVRVTGSEFAVEFDRPLRAITPGQAAVIYAGELVVGGGIIAAASADRVTDAVDTLSLPASSRVSFGSE
jgi:tRNA-specific 2-thiouridylase